MAYLVSRYPAISHTFVLREKLALAAHGIEIEVASINPVDKPLDRYTAEERAEAGRTFYVKSEGFCGALKALAALLVRSPGPFFKTLLYSFRLGGADARKWLFCGFYLIEAVILAEWMRTRGLRHIHVHFATPAATVALLLTKLGPVTLSLTVHGPDEFYDVPGYFLPEKIEAARFICAIGAYAQSQLMRLCGPHVWDKIHVTPLGVDPQHFAPGALSWKNDEFEILCVGRLVPAKAQHLLLHAVAALKERGRTLRLRLAGDGPGRDSLEQTARSLGIERQTVFEGAVNQDQIRDLYKQADVFVLPSFAEGIPVVLMEAMAMQVPCISTWVAGIPELIRSGVDGLLVAAGDASALADAIAELMDDPTLRRRLGWAGRQRVMEKYDLAGNAGKLAGLFHAQLDGAP